MLARWKLYSHCVYAVRGSFAERGEVYKSRNGDIKDPPRLILSKKK